MEQEKTLRGTPRKPQGGARAGSGRKKDKRLDICTVSGLLEELYIKTDGRHYEEILVEDFLEARQRRDSQLVSKYHQLILNKILATQNRLEVVEPADVIESKRQAFADALAKLVETHKG